MQTSLKKSAQQARTNVPKKFAKAQAAFGRVAAKSRRSCQIFATAATKTVKIGTRGSPLALAQAYMTRDLLKVLAGAPMLQSDGMVP